MKRLLVLNYDITDVCLGNELEKVAEIISTGKFSVEAQTADIPSKAAMNKLNDDEVGLILYHPTHGKLKKYAHYNKELTELNIAILLEKADSLPDEIVKTASFFLKNAARRWRVDFPKQLEFDEEINSNYVSIHTDIDKLAYVKKLTPPVNNDVEYSAYALPAKKKYPISDELQIKTASAYFDAYANNMSIPDRLIFSANTEKAAKAIGCKPSEYLEKYASLVNDFNDSFKNHISMRKANTLNEDALGLYDELKEKFEELGPIKTAEALEKIDKYCGLDKLWNRRIEDPVMSTFSMEKTSAVTINNKAITKEDLLKLANLDLNKVIDNNTKNELLGEDGLAVMESLPFPVQDAIVEKLSL